jgi:ribonuclease P protein component
MVEAETNHSFPSSARLKKRREFLAIQGRGHKVWGRRFIYYIRRGSTNRIRIGITTSKKVGNAVRRNRIRRLVREAFRQQPEFNSVPLDIVIIAKRGVYDFSFAAIRDELLDVITRYVQNPPSPSKRASGTRRRGNRRRREVSKNVQGS